MTTELWKCYTCKKFLQDTDPDKAFCSGGLDCYADAGFPEYESISIDEEEKEP